METLVLNLYGLWFWLTRKHRAIQYSRAGRLLNAASAYLQADYAGRASTRDRGSLLPEQVQALNLIESHAALVENAVRRFDSLRDCCRFVTEELTRPAPSSAPLNTHAGTVAQQPSTRAVLQPIRSSPREVIAESADLAGAA